VTDEAAKTLTNFDYRNSNNMLNTIVALVTDFGYCYFDNMLSTTVVFEEDSVRKNRYLKESWTSRSLEVGQSPADLLSDFVYFVNM